MDETEREQKVLEKLRARGFEMRKSAQYAPPGNLGGYMVFDPLTGGSLLGHRFEAELEDVERWIEST